MSSGLLGSAQSLLGSALTLTRARLELFGAELQEELNRFFFSVIGAVAVLLLAALGAAFAAVAVLIAVPESYRAAAAAGMAALLLAAAALAAWSMRRMTRGKPRVFHETLAQLDRDREALRAALAPVAAGMEKADRVVAGMRSALGWALQLAPVLALLRRR